MGLYSIGHVKIAKSVLMQAKEIIQEIDPTYTQCHYCNRTINISKMSKIRPFSLVRFVYVCKGDKECHKIDLRDRIVNNDGYWYKGDNYIKFSSVLKNGLLLTYLLNKVKYPFKWLVGRWMDKVKGL